MSAAISPRRLAMVGFLTFIALGLTQGVLGVAWPTMRVDFGRPLPDLGNLLAISVGGYFLAGLSAGPLTRRFGTGLLLTATMALGSASLLLYAVAGSWPVLLLASAGVGFSGGLLDSVVNAYVALHHGTRTMNLLHASFGIGATTGPLLVATSLARGLSWRAAYVVLLCVELLLVVTVFVIRRRWPQGLTDDSGAVHARVGGPLVLGLLAMFFLHVGLEVTAGQWSYSLLTQSRGVGELAAGIWVASYWGGLTGGRLLLGVIGNRVGPRRILNLSMLGTVLGAAILWWNPVGLGVGGLPIIGFSLAGIFPTLVTLTPSWVGAEKSPSIIGYQVAAASAGSAALPWAVSRLIDVRDLEILGPFLLVIALLMPVLYAFVDRHANGTSGTTSAESTRTLPS
jgi:fucose permease